MHGLRVIHLNRSKTSPSLTFLLCKRVNFNLASLGDQSKDNSIIKLVLCKVRGTGNEWGVE